MNIEYLLEMSRKVESLGSFLSSFSNPLRLQILFCVSESGGASYSDLLHLTEEHGVKPNVLAYHIKQLKRSLLIFRGEDKKYRPTDKGRSVVKNLTSLLRDSTSAEKKQWLQSTTQPQRITKDFLLTLFTSLDVPSHTLPALVESVYEGVQSLPLLTIHPSILYDLVNASLIKYGLYPYLAPNLQMGPTAAELDTLLLSTDDLPTVRDDLFNRVVYDHFLQKFLPPLVRDAHYMGKINLENSRNPFLISRIALDSEHHLDLHGESEPRTPLSLAETLSRLSCKISQELEVFGVQDLLSDFNGDEWDTSSLVSYIRRVLAIRRPKLTLGYIYPSKGSPKSSSTERALHQILASASNHRGDLINLVYYLPPSVPFIKEYRNTLGKLVSSLIDQGGNALFANHMFPWQKGHLYFADGLRLPEGGQNTSIAAAFASINLPSLAAESDGNRVLFEESLFQVIGYVTTYFTQKRSILDGTSIHLNSSTAIKEFKLYYYLNLFGVELIPAMIGETPFPDKDSLSILLDLINETKALISETSRETGLDILLSSVKVEEGVEALFKRVIPQDEKGETSGSTILHMEATLQKFFDGGRSPFLSLTYPPLSQMLHEYGDLSDFFSEEEISTLSLHPL